MAKSKDKNPHGLVSRLAGRWYTIATFAIIYLFILQCFGIVPFEKSLLEIPFYKSLSKSYMLTKTTVTGGDLGSHWVLAQYLRDNLLPTGRLIGWYPHWMGGLPLFQYYFVPPYFLMVLLGPFITLEIAFKLVSAAWIFFTPIAFYYAAKGLGFEKPGPEIAASLSLALTWLETVTGGNYAQWGGNVKSAMAGQFPYGISLAFAVLSLGLLWDGYNSKKRIILNAVVFSMVVLHHLYTTIALGLASTFFVLHALKSRKFDGLFYLAKVFGLGFMIAGFWLIPSYAKLGWSSPPRDVFYGLPSMDWVFIQEYTVFYVLIIAGFSMSLIHYFRKRNSLRNALSLYAVDLAGTVLFVHFINLFLFKHDSYSFYFAMTGILLALQTAVLNREGRILYCLYAFSMVFAMLYLSQLTNLLYARFIPLIFAIYLLLATRAIQILTSVFKVKSLIPVLISLTLVLWLAVGVDDLLNALTDAKGSLNYLVTDGISSKLVQFKTGGKYQWYISHGIKDAPSWLRWNYEGLEVKPAWPGVKEVYNYTAHLPLKGRLNYEYYDYGKLATARIFEASPAFTNRSVMESLLVESSTTFPFFYYMQKTVSETSWWPGFPIKIPNKINLKHGKDIYWAYNVQYYLVYSKTIKDLIKNESDYHYLTTIGTPEAGYFEIYSVNEDSHYADFPKREPILVVTDNWRPFSFKWFDVTDLDVPVVFKSNVDDYDMEHFNIIVLNKTLDLNKNSNTVLYPSDRFLEAVNASRRVNYECWISEDYQGELLLVNHTCVGKSLWVKIPYYPNWKTQDANRIYFASPSLMLIFPDKENVKLYYGWLPSDIAGYVVTLTAFIVIGYCLLVSLNIFRKNIHEPLVGRLNANPASRMLLNVPSKMEEEAARLADGLISGLGRSKMTLIVVLALLWAGSFALDYNARASSCASSCASEGYGGYSIPSFTNVVDNYDMGFNNEKQNTLRNLKCTAVCDPSRKEYIYVSGGGYAEFTMYVKPMEDNILSLRATDNQNCRYDDVYMDGIYVGEIYGIGELGQKVNFDLPLPYTNKSAVRIRLYHNTSKYGCYGFDVFSAQIKLPECACLTEESTVQQRERVFISLLGAMSVAAALIIVAYRLTALNRTLKVRVHNKIKRMIEGTRIYGIQRSLKSRINDYAGKFRAMLLKDRKLAILAIILLVFLYYVIQYVSNYAQMQSICSMECRDAGYARGYASAKNVIDDFQLGADYADGYKKHDFVCGAVCDEQRKNYVYISPGGYIEFDMAVEPNEENTLVITSGNFNELCRSSYVYVNDQYLGEMSQPAGVLPDSEYMFKLPKTSARKVRVRIGHDPSETPCWGHDVFRVKTQLPRCICKQ